MCIKQFLLIVILYHSFDNAQQHQADLSGTDNDYDLIMFTQHWPVTLCKYWKHNNPEKGCAFPTRKDRWTLHGIWPLKDDESGPSFCNDSWPFDIKEIESIRSDLEQAWTNIYKGSEPDDLWHHEWDKHGTCITDLEPFNTQLKYFSKGIEWNLEYSVAEILSAAGLFPSDTREFTPEELGKAMRSKTDKWPMIVCSTIDDVQYLDELRICFDKTLSLIDCDPLIFHTCDVSKGIIYPTRN